MLPHLQDVIDRETNVARQNVTETTAGKGKSEEMLEKIVKGKMSKRLAEITLLGQNHLAVCLEIV